MSRVIKFRGWNPKTKKMLYNFNDCAMGFESNGSLSVAEYMEYGSHEELIDITLLQFTGLHDVYGQPIYEGDIVEYEDSLWKVTWYYDSFDMTNKKGMSVRSDDELDDPGFTEWEKCVVIGNIYENPSLL